MGFTALKRVEVLQIMQHESNIDRFLSISNISTKSLWKRIDPNKEIENKFQVPWEKNSTERRDTGKRVAINSSAPSFSPAQGRYQGRFLCDQSVFRPWHSTLLPEDSSVAISGHSHWFKGVFLRGRPTFSIAPPSSKGVWKGICEYRVSSLEIPSLNAVRSVSRVFSSAFFRCIPKRPPEQQYPAVLSGSRVFFFISGFDLGSRVFLRGWPSVALVFRRCGPLFSPWRVDFRAPFPEFCVDAIGRHQQ